MTPFTGAPANAFASERNGAVFVPFSRRVAPVVAFTSTKVVACDVGMPSSGHERFESDGPPVGSDPKSSGTPLPVGWTPAGCVVGVSSPAGATSSVSGSLGSSALKGASRTEQPSVYGQPGSATRKKNGARRLSIAHPYLRQLRPDLPLPRR